MAASFITSRRRRDVIRADHMYIHHGRDIPYNIWKTAGGNDSVHTVVYLGTVQMGKLARWVAADSPPGTIVIEGPPYWLAGNNGDDLADFMFGFTRHAFEAVMASSTPDALLNIAAESQAVPGVLALLSRTAYRQRVRSLALVQPLGFNAPVYAGSHQHRIGEFKRRVIANLRYQLPALIVDGRLRHNHLILGRTVNFKDLKTEAQYGSGLEYDALPDLKRLEFELRDKILIICGGNDRLFPANEIRAQLERHQIDLPVTVIAGVPHSPPATRFGRRLLTAAFDYFNQV